MKKTRKPRVKKEAVAIPVVEPKPREFGDPPWHSAEKIYGHPYKIPARRVCADFEWYLPPFQRGSVWTPEQQAAYCNSVFQGLPTGQILVWERFVNGKYIHVVIDGQQRLTAMGATVYRSDGQKNPSTAAYFDMATGLFTTEPGRWSETMRTLSNYDFERHLRTSKELEVESEEQRKLWYWRIFAYDRISRVEVLSYTIEARTPKESVIEAFRSVNKPGTPFSEEEVERLIASCSLDELTKNDCETS